LRAGRVFRAARDILNPREMENGHRTKQHIGFIGKTRGVLQRSRNTPRQKEKGGIEQGPRKKKARQFKDPEIVKQEGQTNKQEE